MATMTSPTYPRSRTSLPGVKVRVSTSARRGSSPSAAAQAAARRCRRAEVGYQELGVRFDLLGHQNSARLFDEELHDRHDDADEEEHDRGRRGVAELVLFEALR